MEVNFIDLITYFIVYSFLGWVLESVFKTIALRKPVNSGFLYGPFCPIYGFGAIIMYLFLEDVSNKPFITFCLGFVVLSIWEYMVGTVLEKLFKTKYWDYSDHKFNLSGRVCLTNSIFWGILGVMFIDIIHPLVQEGLAQINPNLILKVDILVVVIMLIDEVVSIRAVLGMKDKLKRVEELNERIREKLEEIKQKSRDIELKNESLQLVVKDLKQKRDRIIRNSYRYIQRIKRAFPTMKSEQITKFLNQKVEVFRKEKGTEEKNDK